VFAGMMIGAYAGGVISDRFGRRIIFLGGMLFTSAFAFMSCFSVNFVMFFIFRLISGIGKKKIVKYRSWCYSTH
jgi:MFS family permease